jgi:hypothetical protein
MNAAFEKTHFHLSAPADFFPLFEQQNTRR